MKKLALFLVAALLASSSCKKKANEATFTLDGTWNWIKTEGKHAPITPAAVGVTIHYQFTPQHTCIFTSNTSVTTETYHISGAETDPNKTITIGSNLYWLKIYSDTIILVQHDAIFPDWLYLVKI